MKARRRVDKPIKKRRGAGKVAPTGALKKDDIKSTTKSHAEKRLRALKYLYSEPKKKAILRQSSLSEIERQLILECRGDGMDDAEIEKWIQEI